MHRFNLARLHPRLVRVVRILPIVSACATSLFKFDGPTFRNLIDLCVEHPTIYETLVKRSIFDPTRVFRPPNILTANPFACRWFSVTRPIRIRLVFARGQLSVYYYSFVFFRLFFFYRCVQIKFLPRVEKYPISNLFRLMNFTALKRLLVYSFACSAFCRSWNERERKRIEFINEINRYLFINDTYTKLGKSVESESKFFFFSFHSPFSHSNSK